MVERFRRSNPAAAKDLRRQQLVDPVIIEAGETAVVLRSSAANLSGKRQSVCIWATQEESSDDGGSQSPIGFVEFGAGKRLARAEFDVRDGVILCIPAPIVSVSVLNRNQIGDPNLLVNAFLVDGSTKGVNTRSYDIDPENPNIRVPAFAEKVAYELAAPNADYRALVSDSPTGETYGQVAEGVVYQLHHRARWIRFFNVPPELGGIVTFFLSI